MCFFSENLIVPEGFLHFTYLVFTVVMLPSSEVFAVALYTYIYIFRERERDGAMNT